MSRVFSCSKCESTDVARTLGEIETDGIEVPDGASTDVLKCECNCCGHMWTELTSDDKDYVDRNVETQ